MTNSTTIVRTLLLSTFVLISSFTLTPPASAQGFISPFIGATIDETDLGCEAIVDCEDKRTTFGVAFGSLGNIFGFELDLAYTKAFFGETSDDASSGLLTVMGNVMLAPKIGPAQPYVLAGLGLIKTNVEFNPSSLLETDQNKFGWDIGGGLMIFFGDHVGIRGDLRYFHAFQDFDVPGLPAIDGTKLDLGRASAAIVFKF
jgi:opacity protein-like surface antigen